MRESPTRHPTCRWPRLWPSRTPNCGVSCNAPTLLDDLGLIPALRWYIKNQLEGFRIAARLETYGFDGSQRKLPFQVETALFRIVQEALTNIAKYAKARTVSSIT